MTLHSFHVTGQSFHVTGQLRRVTGHFAARHSQSPLLRALRFGVVGASGVGVNLAAFWLLSSALKVHYLLAGPLAVELAFLSNYTLNNTWTFADRRARLLSSGLLRCQLVSGGGLLINLLVLHACVSVFGVPSMLANLAGIAVATAWNFGLSVRWTWRPSTRIQAPGSDEERLTCVGYGTFSPSPVLRRFCSVLGHRRQRRVKRWSVYKDKITSGLTLGRPARMASAGRTG